MVRSLGDPAVKRVPGRLAGVNRLNKKFENSQDAKSLKSFDTVRHASVRRVNLWELKPEA